MVTPLPESLDHRYHGYLYFPVSPADGLYPTIKMAGISPILILNPITQRWANYHCHNVAAKIFGKLDDYIWKVTWRWARRRHPDKGNKWIARRYWQPERNRKWVFQTKKNRLRKLSDTKIRRHSRLKLDANPYLDREYFLERKDRIKKPKPRNETRITFVTLPPRTG